MMFFKCKRSVEIALLTQKVQENAFASVYQTVTACRPVEVYNYAGEADLMLKHWSKQKLAVQHSAGVTINTWSIMRFTVLPDSVRLWLFSVVEL